MFGKWFLLWKVNIVIEFVIEKLGSREINENGIEKYGPGKHFQALLHFNFDLSKHEMKCVCVYIFENAKYFSVIRNMKYLKHYRVFTINVNRAIM